MTTCLKVFKLAIEKQTAPDKATAELKEKEIQEHIKTCGSCRSFMTQVGSDKLARAVTPGGIILPTPPPGVLTPIPKVREQAPSKPAVPKEHPRNAPKFQNCWKCGARARRSTRTRTTAEYTCKCKAVTIITLRGG